MLGSSLDRAVAEAAVLFIFEPLKECFPTIKEFSGQQQKVIF